MTYIKTAVVKCAYVHKLKEYNEHFIYMSIIIHAYMYCLSITYLYKYIHVICMNDYICHVCIYIDKHPYMYGYSLCIYIGVEHI